MTTADDISDQLSHPSWGQTQQGHRDEESDSHDGRRWLTVKGHDGSAVHIAVLQHETDAEVVWLYAQHGANLTPAQARSASQALLEAAAYAEDHREAASYAEDHRTA